MRSTPKIVVAGLVACLVLTGAAVAHGAVNGASSGERAAAGVDELGGMRAAPGAVALAVLGVVVALLPRNKV